MGHGGGYWTGFHSVKIPLSLGISHKGCLLPVLFLNRCGFFCCSWWRIRLHSLIPHRNKKKKTLHEPLWCFGYHYTVSEAQFAHQIGSHPRGVCTPVRTCTSGVDSVRVKRLCLVIGAGNFVQMTSLMLNKTKVYLACQKTGLPDAESQCPHISLCW